MVSMDHQEKTLQPQKGRRGPPATGKGTPVQVRMQPNLLAALDAAIQDSVEIMSRPEMVRIAVETWLKEKGYLNDD